MLSTKGDEFIVACQSFLGFGREVMGIRLIVERNDSYCRSDFCLREVPIQIVIIIKPAICISLYFAYVI